MASTIIIDFTNGVVLNDTLTVIVDIGTGSNLRLEERFVGTRYSSFTSSGQSGSTTQQLAAHYAIAFNLDYSNYGGTNNFQANASGNQVQITVNNPGWQFDSATATFPFSFIVNNDTPEPLKSVKFTGYDPAPANLCQFILANFEITGGNGSYDLYVGDIKLQSAVTSPVQIQYTRGYNRSFKAYDTTGTYIGEISIKTPRKVVEGDITFKVTNLSGGATVEVNRVFISSAIEPYEYSLDDVTYVTQNVFTGLANGDYTVYVKDALGCVTQKDFTVDGETELTDTIFNVSEINALRFAKVEDGKKNHKNTLSCNELRNLAYFFQHKYRANDVITTQFKTNALFREAFILDATGNKTVIADSKLTENIGVEVKANATYHSLGGGRSAIYFGVTDLLDPLTDDVLETVNFGFALPAFANQAGKYVLIEGVGQVQIDSINYSDEYDAFVAEFNLAYYGVPETRTVYAKYNLQPYEVYEFDLDMSVLPESFNVVIEVGSSSSNISHTYVSERVVRVTDSDQLFEIDYWDSTNKGDMNYQTGIKHKILLEGMVDYLGDQSTSGYNGGKQYYPTENTIYDSQLFYFPRVSTDVAHKLRLVMAHEFLYINGIQYQIADAPDVKGNINTNIKSFSVILKRGGDQFLDRSQEIITGSSEIDLIGGGIEASQGKSLILWTKNNG